MQERKISTLVFLDFEATGIPKYEFQPKATELCVIAVQREHFLTRGNTPREPRILNKMRICFHPKKPIPYTSYDLTGLCTEELKDQQPVNKDFADMFVLFLRRLPPPICLLSHNGNKFDFRLLQAELKSVGCSLPDTLLCADTYLAFQSVLKNVTNDHLSSLIYNNCTLSCPPAHLQQREQHDTLFENNSSSGVCSMAVNLSMTPRSNSMECQSTCIQSTSFFKDQSSILGGLSNNCSIGGGGGGASTMMFARRNIITSTSTTTTSAGNEEDEEVEVIAIKDQKMVELPAVALAVAELGENGDDNDENNISEVTYPVIDLTEDSSFDGSSEDGEDSDDDSNIIIENETEKEVDNAVPTSSEAEIVVKDSVEKPPVELETTGTSSDPVEDIEQSVKVDVNNHEDPNEEKKPADEPREPVKVEEDDSTKVDEKTDPLADANGNVAINLETDGHNSRKRTRDDEESKNETVISSGGVDSKKDDDQVSSSVVDVGGKPSTDDVIVDGSADRPSKLRKLTSEVVKADSEAAIDSCVVTTPSVSQLTRPATSTFRRTISPPHPKPGYSLVSLHKLLLGHPPVNSHTAEDDAVALLQVCRAAGIKLCNWLDANAVSVNTIQPLW